MVASSSSTAAAAAATAWVSISLEREIIMCHWMMSMGEHNSRFLLAVHRIQWISSEKVASPIPLLTYPRFLPHYFEDPISDSEESILITDIQSS